jgi:hypothetical protein
MSSCIGVTTPSHTTDCSLFSLVSVAILLRVFVVALPAALCSQPVLCVCTAYKAAQPLAQLLLLSYAAAAYASRDSTV